MSATHMESRSFSPYISSRASHLEQFVPLLSTYFSIFHPPDTLIGTESTTFSIYEKYNTFLLHFKEGNYIIYRHSSARVTARRPDEALCRGEDRGRKQTIGR